MVKENKNEFIMMRKRVLILVSGMGVGGMSWCRKGGYEEGDGGIEEVGFREVDMRDGFWCGGIERNGRVWMGCGFKECEKKGGLDKFGIGGRLKKGEDGGDFCFDDSEGYKVIEGGCY